MATAKVDRTVSSERLLMTCLPLYEAKTLHGLCRTIDRVKCFNGTVPATFRAAGCAHSMGISRSRLAPRGQWEMKRVSEPIRQLEIYSAGGEQIEGPGAHLTE